MIMCFPPIQVTTKSTMCNSNVYKLTLYNMIQKKSLFSFLGIILAIGITWDYRSAECSAHLHVL